MSEPRLACTVRGCGLLLGGPDNATAHRALTCPAGHAFDVARSGYVNLLQPQDRRSLQAGDSRDVAEARSRLHDAGVGRVLIETIVDKVRSLASPLSQDRQGVPEDRAAQVADLGCGTGDALAAVAAAVDVAAIGIDLSVPAIERASRRYPALTWVVANADRQLPLPDASTRLLLSITSRRNPSEASRVLAPGGYLLMVLPAPDDLIELRAAVQGKAIERDRVESLIAEHDALFTVEDRLTVRERIQLDAGALKDLLRITYRGARSRSAPAVDALPGMDVTLAADLVLLAPRRT